MHWLKPIFITMLSIVVLAWLVPTVSYASWGALLAASVVLTILQKFVRPILKVLFLPINIITLGLFSWVISAFILWLAMFLVPGFHIDQVALLGFSFGKIMSLVVVSFLLSLIQSLIDWVL